MNDERRRTSIEWAAPSRNREQPTTNHQKPTAYNHEESTDNSSLVRNQADKADK
jgi:hypothetical protein